jgi:hypothetical protein
LQRNYKGLGYENIYTGKWETGFATDLHMPLQRGFDNFLGFFDDVTDYYTKKYKGDSLKDALQKLIFYDRDEPPAKITQNFYVYMRRYCSRSSNRTNSRYLYAFSL